MIGFDRTAPSKGRAQGVEPAKPIDPERRRTPSRRLSWRSRRSRKAILSMACSREYESKSSMATRDRTPPRSCGSEREGDRQSREVMQQLIEAEQCPKRGASGRPFRLFTD